MANDGSRDSAYRQIALIGWPPDRSAFIAACGQDYGSFDLLEAYIDSQSGEISLSSHERTAHIEMLDRILSKFDARDHAHRYVSAIKQLVRLA